MVVIRMKVGYVRWGFVGVSLWSSMLTPNSSSRR
jgi:hypothetical protein